MPPGHDEEVMITAFADVHYFFCHPEARPLHHRFDKASYVYLYRNSRAGLGRLEIANNPGTGHQDAMAGSLADAALFFHPNQASLLSVTRTFEGCSLSMSESEWTLRTYTLENDIEVLTPIHSMDIYFWGIEDAQQSLQALRKMGSAVGHLAVDGKGGIRLVSEQASDPLVQRLESLATSSPASQGTKLPAPPPLASHRPVVASYNPASPRAPEPLVYRAKTPPPADAEGGVGAVMRGEEVQAGTVIQRQPYGPPPQSSAIESVTPEAFGPPAQAPATPPDQFLTSFAPPPTAQTNTPQRLQGIFRPPSVSASPVRALPLRNEDQPKPQYATYGNSLPPPPPVVRGTTAHTEPEPSAYQHQQSQMYSPSYYAQGQAQGHATPTYMPSPGLQPGFSPYHQPQSAQTGMVSPYAVHSQAYRPTEEELAAHGDKNKQSAGLFGALDARAVKMEKGFGKWLGRLDKRL